MVQNTFYAADVRQLNFDMSEIKVRKLVLKALFKGSVAKFG